MCETREEQEESRIIRELFKRADQIVLEVPSIESVSHSLESINLRKRFPWWIVGLAVFVPSASYLAVTAYLNGVHSRIAVKDPQPENATQDSPPQSSPSPRTDSVAQVDAVPGLKDGSAWVGIPVGVKISVSEIENTNLAVATEIHLPTQVRFYSEKYPKIRDFSDLRIKLVLANGRRRENIAFVVVGTNQGARELDLRFFDPTGKILTTKKVQIKFEVRPKTKSRGESK